MHVTPTSLTFSGENPVAQSVKITGLTDTQAWRAEATEGILVTTPDATGVNDYSCSIKVPSLPVGSSGSVTISAPGHESVVVDVEHVA